MRVRMLQSIAGERFAYAAGQEIDSAEAPLEITAWLSVPLADGTFRAEIIEEARVHQPEMAMRRTKTRRR